MKQIYISILLLIFSLSTFTSQAQKMDLVDVLDALSRVDVIILNKKFKKQLMKDMKMLEQRGTLPLDKYQKLEIAYNNLYYTYNNDYLVQLKLDLGDAERFKQVVKNPAKATAAYLEAYERVVDSYNNEFQPAMLNTLSPEEQENSDIITIISIGFKLFRKVVDVIKQRKFQKEDAFNIVMSQVNKRLFKKLELPEWESFDLTMEEGGGYNSSANNGEYIPPPPPPPPSSGANNGEYIPPPPPPPNSGANNGEYIPPPPPPPPFSTSSATTISGNFYLEIYDENLEKNSPLALQKGASNNVQVQNFGVGNTSADMIIGKPPKKGSLRNNNHSLHNTITTNTTPFSTVETYPADTYYQIKATGDGFIYLFAINSGNRMYGFFPSIGTVEEISSGYSYTTPDNTNQLQTTTNTFTNSPQTMVTIPNREDYLMTHDPEGASIPASEQLVLLFSKAELNMKDVFYQMEATSESLSPEERLAAIFGSQTATLEQAEVVLQQGFFSYQLKEDDPSILPIVISIKRR